MLQDWFFKIQQISAPETNVSQKQSKGCSCVQERRQFSSSNSSVM